MSVVAPNSMTRLRACQGCRLILPSSQFVAEGCPNCPNSYFQGDRQAVELGTSKTFSGCVGVVDTKRSWVARHIQIETGVPGMYAIAVQGEGEETNRVDEEDEYEEDENGIAIREDDNE